MSDIPKVKVTYQKQSFTVDKIEMLSMADLKSAEGQCFADFMRRMEQEIVHAMGIPRGFLDASVRRERQLREIMGEEFIEDNANAPVALVYWRLIAS